MPSIAFFAARLTSAPREAGTVLTDYALCPLHTCAGDEAIVREGVTALGGKFASAYDSATVNLLVVKV